MYPCVARVAAAAQHSKQAQDCVLLKVTCPGLALQLVQLQRLTLTKPCSSFPPSPALLTAAAGTNAGGGNEAEWAAAAAACASDKYAPLLARIDDDLRHWKPPAAGEGWVGGQGGREGLGERAGGGRQG